MYQLLFDEENEAILQIGPTGTQTVINDDFPSRPEFSPDGKKALFISPLEWEVPGSLYLYDLENGHITELVKPDKYDYIPKYAVWISSEVISLVIGFGSGTVSVGGNVFTYNIINHQINKISHYPDQVQVTKLTLNDSLLELNGIKYTDDNFNIFTDFHDTISINEYI